MRAREVVLAVTGAGRSAMVFTSAPGSEGAIPELADVITSAMANLEGVVLAQALLQPEEENSAQAFEAAGWQEIAQLAYMRRSFEKKDWALASDASALPGGVTLRGFRGEEDEKIFAQALEVSYIDTLDCPELCGMRAASDVIESHRAAGQFDPELWWLLEDASGPAGVLLFNPNPEQDAIELVYIGLAPRLRGTGLARRLMEIAIGRLASYPGREITCAVDLRNSPARRLYESLGFRLFGRRRALVCALESITESC